MTSDDTSVPAGAGGGTTLRRRLPLLAVLAVSAALQARMMLLVRHYSVNVLFYDQWDFYLPMFRGEPVSTFFFTQVGPHRQGVGFLIYKYVSELSGWDTRVEALAICVVVFIALFCALWLKARLFGPLTYWDVAIPPLFLTPALTALYTLTPNPSHGAFPLLLIVLYCVGWSLRGRLKYPLVLLLNLLLIYTGFGLFVGAITPTLLALECYRAARRGERRELAHASLALLLSLASLGSFFVGYYFEPAVSCFRFPDPRPFNYFWYVSLMFARFWRVGGQGLAPYVAGAFLTVIVAALCARHTYLLLRDRAGDRRVSVCITALSGLTLLFALNAAFGRVCTGIDTAQAARYMPYVVPAFLAFYFELLLSSRPGGLLRRFPPGRRFSLGHVALAGFTAASLLTAAPLTRAGALVLEAFRKGKSEWRRCYLETENVVECNARTNFEVYPAKGARPPEVLEGQLLYLKRNRLNLFSGD